MAWTRCLAVGGILFLSIESSCEVVVVRDNVQ